MTKPRIAIIIGSTRDTRFADKPAGWLLDKARARDDIEVDLVDLADFDLPLFNEAASNRFVPSADPRAVRWQQKIDGYDGYIFLVAEYNHSITGALKNALDHAAVEWNHKPVGALGYGGVGAARAVEHLRSIAVELGMVPVKSAIHLAAGAFMEVHPMGQDKDMEAVDAILAPSATALLDDISWWAYATKDAREEYEAAA